MADAGRPTEPDRRPDGDAPEGFADPYAEAYRRFPQERRAGGAARPITLFDLHQDSHEMVDPATSVLVIAVLLEGNVRHAEFDVGDGFAPGSDRPGMMQVLPVGAEMANRVEGPHRVLVLATPWAGLAELLAADGAGDDDPFRALVGRAIDEPAPDALMRRLWREAGRDAVASSLMVDGLLMQLLATLGRLAGAPEPARTRGDTAPLDPRRLARVKAYAEANLAEPLTVEELARAACLSTFHFARAFRAATGRTPHGWVTERRVARARRLLTDPALPLAQVALAAGFASQSHFGQVFRQEVGATPGAYRREALA